MTEQKSSIMVDEKRRVAPIKNKKGKKLETEITSPLKRMRAWSRMSGPKIQIWMYLIILSVTISLLLFPELLVVSKEQYSLGDVAQKDIKASDDFLVEDKELTEQRRDEGAKSSLFVYDFDTSGAAVNHRMKESFSYGRTELQRILLPKSEVGLESPSDLDKSDHSEQLRQLEGKFFELSGVTEDSLLFDQIVRSGFSHQIENNVLLAVKRVLKNGVVGNKTVLMTQEGKGIILRDIDTQKEVEVVDLDRFYDLEGARQRLSEIIEQLPVDEGGSEIAEATIRLAQLAIRPNATFNKKETELLKEEARESVKPIYFKVKKGEMIIREGEKINPTHLLKLEAKAKLKRNPPVGVVLSMALVIGILLTLSYEILVRRPNTFRGDTRSLIFLSLTLLFMFSMVLLYNRVAEEVARGFYFFNTQVLLFALPISLGALLVSIFQGLDVAIAFSLVISILASIALGWRLEYFVYFLMGSFLAAYGVRNCRERMVLIKTGLWVGVLNIVMALAIHALSIQTLFGDLYSPAGALSILNCFLGGSLAGVIAAGFLPLIEIVFGFTTDIKLLELSSLDQPILKDLMVKAPGTYHHSVIVSNMVEATAESINANPLLAKVSAYYHDIGKIKKPLYFVENQERGDKRHEKLAPSMSSLILISHVKDGVELAKQHRLGKEIIDIIQQHQGTRLISYFYQKAKEQGKGRGDRSSPVEEEDFRYPGPKPQTKEAGLVLLADAVEAASRTVVDPTPARIKGMVQKIINNVFSDGQLDECELTLKDLNQIAKSFTKTLSGIFHSRIEYPDPIVKGDTGKKRGNGNSNNLAAPHERPRPSEDKEEAREDLKRLGVP
jgi:putative nucleotidyltransferase with HDIG domain